MHINPTQSAKMQQQIAALKESQKIKQGQTNEAIREQTTETEPKADLTSKNYKMDSAKVAELKAQFAQQTSSFKEMIRKMLEKQGIEATTALGDLHQAVLVDPETKAKAIETISEQGEWGVEKTSARILDFAKALAGSDPSKIEMLKHAFEQGFAAAEKAFGGKLPDISKQTYDKVMKGFDDWKNEGVKTTNSPQ